MFDRGAPAGSSSPTAAHPLFICGGDMPQRAKRNQLRETTERRVRLPDGRESARRRGYDATWERLRRMVLAESPLCADPFGEHAAVGRVEVATEVHHVVRLRVIKGRDNGSTRAANRRENLLPLCKSCHSRVTNEEKRRDNDG